MSATTTRRIGGAILASVLVGCGSAGLETGDPLITDTGPTPDEAWRRDVGRAVELGPLSLDGDWVVAPTEGPLLRLKGADGAERWKRKLPAGAASDPVLCANVLVVATDVPSGEVLAVDPTSGEVRWKWGRSVGFLAASDTVLIFAGRGGRVLRLDPGDGTPLWELHRPGSGWRAPVLHGGTGLVFVPVRPDSVIAIDFEGQVVWSRRAGGWPRLGMGESTLFVATDDSLLLAWAPESGTELRRRVLPALVAGRPLPVGETLYLALRDGRLWALDGATLDELWSTRFEPPLLSPPTAAGSLLYQSGTRGRIYVVAAGTGAPVDTLQHPESLIAPPGYGPDGVAAGGDEGTLVGYRRLP